MYNKSVSLKYNKHSNMYSNSTGSLTFNPHTMEAFSYKWWKFAAVIDGLVVFNNHKYSVTTSKHQNKIRQLLIELGIKIDIEIPLPEGINSNNLEDLFLQAEEYLCNKFLNEELKRQERNEKAKQRRLQNKQVKELI